MALIGLVAAVTAMVLGILWDISWDASIGVDSFWSPPHMATNFGAAVAGLCGAVLLCRALPGTAWRAAKGGGAPTTRAAVGAGLAVWGAVAMLGFLILEDWWSRAYGLYGERWSPPEVLFTAAGATLLCGAAIASARGRGSLAAPWVIGLTIAFAVAAMTPYGMPNLHRTGTFYATSALLFPPLLAFAAAADGRPWSATLAALCYATLVCLLLWTLPLFPATPRIGPIYEPVESLIPPRFPLLLLLPALAIDVCTRRFGTRAVAAVACAASFLSIFVPVQWWFASFLLSPAADNWIFAGGGRHWPFYVQIGPERAQFWGQEGDGLTPSLLLGCTLVATLGSLAGLRLGAWVREEAR